MKSQVTLEDIVKATHELLEDNAQAPVVEKVEEVIAPMTSPAPVVTPEPAPAPVEPAPIVTSPPPVTPPHETPAPPVAASPPPPIAAPAPAVVQTPAPAPVDPTPIVVDPPVAMATPPAPIVDNSQPTVPTQPDANSTVNDPVTAPTDQVTTQTPPEEVKVNTANEAKSSPPKDTTQASPPADTTPVVNTETAVETPAPPADAPVTTNQPESVAAPAVSNPNPTSANQDDSNIPSLDEISNAPAIDANAIIDAQTAEQEQTTVENEIANFVNGATTDANTPTLESDANPEAATAPTDTALNENNAITDDKLMNDAVNSLMDGDVADSPQVPVNPPEKPVMISTITSGLNELPEVKNASNKTLDGIEDDKDQSPSDNAVTIAHKKVINPIDDPNKKDIQELYAMEQSKLGTNLDDLAGQIVTGSN